MTIVLEDSGLTWTLRGADPGPEETRQRLKIFLKILQLNTYFHLQVPIHQALKRKYSYVIDSTLIIIKTV